MQFRCESIWEHSLERGEKFTNLEAEDRNDALSDAGREDKIADFSALEINILVYLAFWNIMSNKEWQDPE